MKCVPGLDDFHVPEIERVHGVGQAQRVHAVQRRGHGEGEEGGRRVRLLHGGRRHRVQHGQELRPHPDREPARLQGLRNRFTTRYND